MRPSVLASLSIKKIVCKNIHSDIYANHFSQFSNSTSNILKPAKLDEIVKFDFFWQGDILSLMIFFRTHQWRLCMKGYMAILQSHNIDPRESINLCTEICSACIHKALFHRYTRTILEERPDGQTNCKKK